MSVYSEGCIARVDTQDRKVCLFAET
jgi:hypothetical protein